MAEVEPPVLEVEPENIIRKWIFFLVRLDAFDYFITAVILMNTVTMCMDYYGASEEYLHVLNIFNYIFVGIFI